MPSLTWLIFYQVKDFIDPGQSESSLNGGQDERRKAEMVWTCEEEICRCPSEED